MNVAGDARFPGQAPIDAYGNGGFRFAEMSHRGSLLCLPSGIYGWDVDSGQELSAVDLRRTLDELKAPDFLLLGTGERQHFPSADLRASFAAAGIGLEAMNTGAACRTYNVLLAEGRPVAAALVAVD